MSRVLMLAGLGSRGAHIAAAITAARASGLLSDVVVEYASTAAVAPTVPRLEMPCAKVDNTPAYLRLPRHRKKRRRRQ